MAWPAPLLRPAARALLILVLFLSSGAAAWAGQCVSPAFGLAVDGYPLSGPDLDRLEEQAGVRPVLVNFFLQWPADPARGSFPLATLDAIARRGALACVTWEPMHYETGREAMVPAGDILGGRYDPYLERFARAAADWGKPFLIRFAHEMNIERYHWGTDKEGYGPASPELYRRMHRRVVEAFRAAGARNARFVFCPNAESVPDVSYAPLAGWNTVDAYWPGSEYVDVLGMDGYNWGTTRTVERHGWSSRWQSFEDLFGPLRGALLRLAPDKPLAVFETSSAAAGGDKDRWLRLALETAQRWGLRALVWFEAAKEVDWRLAGGVREDTIRRLRQGTCRSAPGDLAGNVAQSDRK